MEALVYEPGACESSTRQWFSKPSPSPAPSWPMLVIPRWSWGRRVGGDGCASLGLPRAGPTASRALFCTATGPGTGSKSALGTAAAMGTSGQGPTNTAQGPLLLPELRFYSGRALSCFLNKLLVGNALVSAFPSVLFCT